jgi:hypothetical protein
MTGTLNSKLRRLGTLALLASSCPCTADELTLNGEARLAGTVTAITENGGVRLLSPLAAEPLQVRPGSLKKITFAESPETLSSGTTRVKLLSGDILPCELKSLDGDSLKVGTSFSGELGIPRSAISSLELGILSEKPLYVGTDGMKGWTTNAWRFKDGTFSSFSTGPLSRAFELPDQYIIRFRLSWKGMPNIRMCFADPLDQQLKSPDRYLMQFNNSGFTLHRQNSNSAGRTYLPFTTLTRRPDSFNNSQMNVEVRVDRTQSMVWLYLDGNLEGRFTDATPAPKSGGISFESNTGNESEHRISDFRILSWDATGDRHRTEDRGDKKSDALIDAQGDRYSGRLESVTLGANSEPSLVFRSPLLEEPIVIPAKKVSTVFFAETKATEDKDKAMPLILTLRDGGTLKVASCTLSGDDLQVAHPLLGPLTLKRASLLSIEQAPPASETESKE